MSICLFHSDPDGMASGAIINLWANDDSIEFIPVNYNYKFPFEEIKKDEQLYIVDFSLSKEDFEKLLTITKNVVWIDHHKSAIELFKNTEVDKLPGIREIGRAGCELTWEYCFKGDETPEIIHRIGRFDVWDFSEYGEELDAFVCGLALYNTLPTSKNWETWIEKPKTVDLIIEKGWVAKSYRDGYYIDYLKSWGFESHFEGHKSYCCNLLKAGSQLFNSINKQDYDLLISFGWDGEQWNISLYSEKENIDCAELCSKYGGGGHKGAAGFTIEELDDLPFKRVKRNELEPIE